MPAEFNRRGIFSSKASAEAENLVLRPELFKGRPSFPAFTIDYPNTQRRDDAIGHLYVVFLIIIHISFTLSLSLFFVCCFDISFFCHISLLKNGSVSV